MDFKEYDAKREQLTKRFIEQADPLRRARNIEAWREVRLAYSREIRTLHAKWQASLPDEEKKVMG